ncbi:daptide-type RiPP biosynthesis aminotransferase [Streptomyces sioyaensis]|uniref:daptide-type RiPP biosynthesis aminotransferase n=1 Tax=Streptomyces sioyaensis TaxID=67364 RepID=UPI0033C24C1A
MLPPSEFGRMAERAVSARGTRVTLADGRKLLCGTSGLWNTNLGYGNPAIAEAVYSALREASYLSVFRYENEAARQAADALVAAACKDSFQRVIFSTSGGAANDLAMKLARYSWILRGSPHRNLIVGLRGSYHGLTFGAFSLTGEDLGQPSYGVDRRTIRHTTPNDPEQLRTLVRQQGNKIAAVVVEPVLGTGAIPLTNDFVEEALRLRAKYGFLLIADEVATGFGRTGRLFAHQEWPEPPDVAITSKGLTNGTCAAAALLVSPAVYAYFERNDSTIMHGETQAGTPPTSAAIMATLNEMHRLKALTHAQRVSNRLDEALARITRDHPFVTGTTGKGCFRSIRLTGASGEPLATAHVPALVRSIRAAGAITHPGPHGIQVIPALTYSDSEVDELADCISRGLNDFTQHMAEA